MQRFRTKDVDYGRRSGPVFVNDHLLSSNKRLLRAAIAKKKSGGWKFAWYSGGKIFARKDEEASVFRTAGMSDVEEITNWNVNNFSNNKQIVKINVLPECDYFDCQAFN